MSPFFFFNDTATTEIYTLSLHDALPISIVSSPRIFANLVARRRHEVGEDPRSEEHTSELQSLAYLVCRLLLEKKKNWTERATYRAESGRHCLSPSSGRFTAQAPSTTCPV